MEPPPTQTAKHYSGTQIIKSLSNGKHIVITPANKGEQIPLDTLMIYSVFGTGQRRNSFHFATYPKIKLRRRRNSREARKANKVSDLQTSEKVPCNLNSPTN